MTTTDTDRISVNFYSNSFNTQESNSEMLMSDFHRNIVPLHYDIKYGLVNCNLSPPSSIVRQQILELLPSHERHSKDDLKLRVMECISNLAHYIAYNGFVVLEHITSTDKVGKPHYKLEPVHGKEIVIGKHFVFQHLPNDAANHLGVTKPIEIPLEKCFIIEFPDSLCGKDKYLNFLEDFKKTGQQSPLLRYYDNILSKQQEYDFKEHEKVYTLELWRKSKIINWHHRASERKLFSGYYQIYRRLLFRKSQIILRDYIIEQLNQIISILSERLGEKTEIVVEGLPTINMLNEVLEQWETGKLLPNTLGTVLW